MITSNSNAVETENNRFLNLLKDSEIKESLLKVTQQALECMLNESAYVGKNSPKIAADIFYNAERWSHCGRFVLIKGNEWDVRAMVGDILLCRYAYSVRREESLGIKKIKMSELLIVLSSFGDESSQLFSELCSVPCLLIKEPALNDMPKQLNNAIPMLDIIIERRLERKLTTIITLPLGKFSGPEKFGARFADIIKGKIKSYLLLLKDIKISTNLFDEPLTEEEKINAFKVEEVFDVGIELTQREQENEWENTHYHPDFIKWKYNRVVKKNNIGKLTI